MWFYSEMCRVRWTDCLAWVSGVASFPPLRAPFPASCATPQNNLPFKMTVGGKSLHLGT